MHFYSTSDRVGTNPFLDMRIQLMRKEKDSSLKLIEFRSDTNWSAAFKEDRYYGCVGNVFVQSF
jgi:hypothetical protein